MLRDYYRVPEANKKKNEASQEDETEVYETIEEPKEQEDAVEGASGSDEVKK